MLLSFLATDEALPLDSAATLPGNKSALVVAAVYDRTSKTELYNTLYTVNASDPTTVNELPIERVVKNGLFYAVGNAPTYGVSTQLILSQGEILYGDLGIMTGQHNQ